MTIGNLTIRQILLKRGNTEVTSAYVGPIGEVVLDTDLQGLRIQDGITPGGTLIFNGQRGYLGSRGNTGYTGSIGSNGTIGYTGSQGTAGLTGAIGATGPQGTSIDFKGSVTTEEDLPASGNQINDAYIETTTGNLWVWNGSEFTNVGQIVGPSGSQGPVGYVGSQGTVGATGPTGPIGYAGSQGTVGATGETGATGDIGATGPTGETGATGATGETGLGFIIAKSYSSVFELEADTAPTGIVAGQFAIVETGDIDDPENSKLYLWTGSVYNYVTDLSGAAGITGPAGATGATGPSGMDALWNWGGTYDNGYPYNEGDIVVYDGSTWRRNSYNISYMGFAPGPGFGEDYWNLVAARGDIGPSGATGETGPTGPSALWNFTGAYDGVSQYNEGDIVTYEGESWIRNDVDTSVSGFYPGGPTYNDDPPYWIKIAAKGDQGPAANIGDLYVDGDVIYSTNSNAYVNFDSNQDGGNILALGTNDGAHVKISTDGGNTNFEFVATDGAGSITFPDGTVQTTAYIPEELTPSYKGFKAIYGRMYNNYDDPNGPINKIVIYQDSATPSSTVDTSTSSDAFSVTGLSGSVVALLVVVGENIVATSVEELKSFAESVIDNVILDGGVEGVFNTVEAMKEAFYDNYATFSAVLTDRKTDLEFFSVSNDFSLSPSYATGSGATFYSINYNLSNDTLEIGGWGQGAPNTHNVGDVFVIPGDTIQDPQGNFLSTPANDVTVTVTDANGGFINTVTVTGNLPRPEEIWPENSIGDGGDDEYDTANYINTNLESQIGYNSGNIVLASGAFDGGDYVVTYQQGIFGVFAGGIGSSFDTIGTSGNSGFDGDGQADTGSLYGAEAGGTGNWAFATNNINNSTTRASIRSVPNSAGDGSGLSTLELRPDTDASGDGYLVVDPTGPNHIHLRAGGTQDNSGTELYIGGENSHLKLGAGSNPNLYIRSNNEQWTFDNNGDLTVPNYIYFDGGTLIGDEPGGGPPVFRITSPLGYGVTIQTDSDISGNNYNWVFSSTGSLTLPGDIKNTQSLGGNIRIITASEQGDLNKTWTFTHDGVGNLTAPQESSMVAKKSFNVLTHDTTFKQFVNLKDFDTLSSVDFAAINIINPQAEILDLIDPESPNFAGNVGARVRILHGYSFDDKKVTETTLTGAFAANGTDPLTGLPQYTGYIADTGVSASEIREFGIGVSANWNFKYDGNLTLPGGASILSSNYDATIRAGNDRSSVFGQINIQTSNPGGNNTWSFGTQGELTLPSGGEITSVTVVNSILGTTTNSISLIPPTSGYGSDPNQRLDIYPTEGEGNHIHLTAGDQSSTDLYLGNDSHYVAIGAMGQVDIQANIGSPIFIRTRSDIFNTTQWSFDSDGTFTIPSGGNVVFDSSAVSRIQGINGIEFANDTVQTTAWLGKIDRLENGSANVILANTGIISLPPVNSSQITISGATRIVEGNPYSVRSAFSNEYEIWKASSVDVIAAKVTVRLHNDYYTYTELFDVMLVKEATNDANVGFSVSSRIKSDDSYPDGIVDVRLSDGNKLTMYYTSVKGDASFYTFDAVEFKKTV